MKEIVLDAQVANIEKVTDFVNEVLESNGCPMKAQLQIDVAIDEIMSNVAFYGYPDDNGQVRVTVDFPGESPKVVIAFEDNGVEFNPLAKDDPDVTLSAEDRLVGGLGIFIVKKTMDDVRYERKDNKNILTIEKTIAKA